MKIRFTTEGDCEILIENDMEKEIFPCIIRDARSQGREWMSDSLGPDFEDEWFPCWQEWVQPEVQQAFSAQLESVNKRRKDVNNVIRIPAKELELWYGAVNQARMVLDDIFHFLDDDLSDDFDEVMSDYAGQWEAEKQGAYHRMHFYAWFQEIMLEGMMQFAPWNKVEESDDPLLPEDEES